MKRRPSMLVILDGWGYREEIEGNAVALAETPVLDRLWAEHPHTLIEASGLAVGLPDGQMGNSEVGHLNIGAGRTVYQSLTRITKSVADGDFFENPALLGAAKAAGAPGRSLHLMGLVSPGGVHSHTDHLLALVRLAKQQGLARVFIHAFLDGRDTPPRSAGGYLAALEEGLARIGVGEISSVSGRYYAMDRDNRWERVRLAYDALTLGTGLRAKTAEEAVKAAYARGEDDEFVKPTNIAGGAEAAVVRDGDAAVFFNFRPDRARELTRAFTEPGFDGFAREKKFSNLYFVTMTEYDRAFSHVRVAFRPEEIENTLGAYIGGLGLKQLRIAETEKYAHVTFFFNGGVEAPNPGEDRVLIPSPKVATYDLQPEMSAYEVAARTAGEIGRGVYDMIILNFANMDMVGHTGVLEAAIKAVSVIDECVGMVADAALAAGGQLLLTADHGNSEEVETAAGEKMTAHTSNPVRLILVRGGGDGGLSLAAGGTLADLAPTLLDMMELPKPPEMTGHSLLRRGREQ
ncbi:MAG: 2,3-bisphosphoglycerate-independent phosphoglycerate mutase [Clostridiales Family XIII bacterium]|nr:2,3-bisphosphoglycerate-independent phosphoglycerate mutase [Clostridiales Family XIII bacterium]